MNRFNFQSSRGYGGQPLPILAAESYLDGSTLSIAQSLTDLAQQPTHDLTLGRQLVENRKANGTATPPILKARQADIEMNRYSERRKSSDARSKEAAGERSDEQEEQLVAKKKRKRKNSGDGDVGDEADKKKLRGRPRLDKKDETAADRRRTQIRMAQRAYRNRKETTVNALEKQVEHLQSITDEMNITLSGLYDLAAAKGILQTEPEFGNRLLTATKRFLALSKSADEDQTAALDDSSSPHLSIPASPKYRDKTANQPQDSHRSLPEDAKSSEVTTTSVWGYEISQSSADDIADTTYTTECWPDQLPMPPPPKHTDHEIIARPAKADAGFSLDMHHNSAVPDASQNDYHVTFATSTPTTSLDTFSMHLPEPFNPWTQLTLPITYAHQESSFGRRLHRIMVERGYDLLMNPRTSPRTYERVFGLALRSYTKEMIAEGMRRVIARHKGKPLSQRDLPFIHLGGPGTHFPPAAEENSSSPKNGTGRGISLLTEIISESQEKDLLNNFPTKVPGYDGLWFDTYDVENHLNKRGIHIPPNVEWFKVDLDKLDLGYLTTPATMMTPVNLSTQTSNGTTGTPASPQPPYRNNLDMQHRQHAVQSVDASLEFCMAGMGDYYATSSFTAPFVPGTSQNFGVNWPDGVASRPLIRERQHSDDDSLDFISAVDAAAFFDNTTSEASLDTGRTILVNTTTLMQAIMRKGICLGRAPGFRPQDVDKALREVIRDAC